MASIADFQFWSMVNGRKSQYLGFNLKVQQTRTWEGILKFHFLDILVPENNWNYMRTFWADNFWIIASATLNEMVLSFGERLVANNAVSPISHGLSLLPRSKTPTLPARLSSPVNTCRYSNTQSRYSNTIFKYICNTDILKYSNNWSQTPTLPSCISSL